MHETIRVAQRFCGPPDSANGGYVGGLLARHVHGDAEVTLRRPPPLDRDLDVEVRTDGAVVLRAGDAVVADAVPAAVDIVVPEAVTVEEARRVAGDARVVRSPELHPFPTCFVCGPHRERGDGLRLFPAAIPGRAVVAAIWQPDASVIAPDLTSDGVPPEIVWAALDCPSSFSMYLEPELEGPYVLGRLGVHVDGPVAIG
ncbi:MAG: hypothetical protein JWL83_822, partial [Actinomycetia bacterium]|nr:hypothetical protein [Actinomycetes bacterium]